MKRKGEFFTVAIPRAVFDEAKANAVEVFGKNLTPWHGMDHALASVYLDAFTAGARFAIDRGMVKP